MKNNFLIKQVLIIDLAKKEYAVKSYDELYKYIGGVGLGLKLLSQYQTEDPIIYSVGPLNGFFPYASKTSVVLRSDGVIEDLYLGGSLSFRLKFSGIDSVVIKGVSKEPVILDIRGDTVNILPADADLQSLGLPGKRSVLAFGASNDDASFSLAGKLVSYDKSKLYLDRYFTSHEKLLERKFLEKNIMGIVFTGSVTFPIKDTEKYAEIFSALLMRSKEVSIAKSDAPSCSGCPLGCAQSREGEIGGNLLAHCMVSCSFAQAIYSDVNTVFSCLNVLGYDYTHEDIENAPLYISQVLKEIDGK